MDIEVQVYAVGQQFEGIDVQNMDMESSKISFEVQNCPSERFPKTKMTFKDILEYSRVIPA